MKRSVDGSAVSVSVVVGSPGVGKSRLAAELVRRATGVTTLWGRCLSYGEGITYWPLREVLEQADESTERDAVLEALDAETPPPAPETAWLFRRFCETCARERPLLLVFDDIHWAEPTFLDLVEHLADKGTGATTVVCVAREELTEGSPTFLEGRANTTRILLDALSGAETDALLDGLGGTVLESDQRARIVEAAEGNPLFLEQLLALALEGGLAERPFPETIQALLAARLDRLGPGERAVLERAAVIGKRFVLDDVVALLDAEAVPTAEAHLDTLGSRGFVRQVRDGELGFRHVLVQEAVYRAVPKRLRAELHERYADRLDDAWAELSELDEFVGYHLEQAHRLRMELGESDRRTERLAEDGGRRLGEAGIRAWRRTDVPATVGLLTRATSLLPTTESRQQELLCELGMAHYASRDLHRAVEVLTEAMAASEHSGDRRAALRARIELEYVELRGRRKTSANGLLHATADAIPIFESVDDNRALGRAWLLTGWVEGGRFGNHAAWAEGANRALEYYKAADWPTSTCLGELAAALHWGPTHVDSAVTRCEQLLLDEATDRVGGAYVSAFLGGLVAQQAEFRRARELVDVARITLNELGISLGAATFCSQMLSEIERLAGNLDEAERILRELADEFERTNELSRLASTAGELSHVLVLQGRLEESDQWTRVAEQHSTEDDLHARIRWFPVRALIHARRGEVSLADDLGREAALIADATDDLNRRAITHTCIGQALHLGGRATDALAEFDEALELYEQKGNLPGAAHVHALRDELALV